MPASKRLRNPFAIVVSASLAWSACGGSTSAPASADDTDTGKMASSREDDDTSSSGSETTDESESAGAAPAKAACDDGTCIVCGDAQCPAGWYCDESAKGGPACGWLPECAKKPTCACVKRVFSSCDERDGGLYVKQ